MSTSLCNPLLLLLLLASATDKSYTHCDANIDGMSDTFEYGGTRIPISDNKGEKMQVVFYPDELPEDSGVLSDVLRGVFAPFKVWRHCAVRT